MPRNDGIAAVVPAAGRSSRAGAFKPLLPMGDKTVLERVIDTLRSAGVEIIVVVIGHNREMMIPEAERLGASWALNEYPGGDMLSSVRAGVRALPVSARKFFLLPADMPMVREGTLRALMELSDRDGSAVVYPVLDGRKGHPPLIDMGCAPAILAHEGGGGLRDILSLFGTSSSYLPCGDPGVLMDIDTMADYRSCLDLLKS
ncbi:MAG: nucleotidyltransferase family protein [Spirochaetes bacterium]|nr:nucleotidyltransferase family protein [Spirochaetota bacterium]